MSSSRNFSVIEPHPTVPKTGGYVGGGRGGAGNFKRYKPSEITAGTDATGPASLVSLLKPASTRRPVLGGRGGAGNTFTPRESEEPMFKFDEELVKAREASAPVYKIGRGGAGNFVDERKPSRSGRTGSSDSASSTSSQDSTGSFFGRVSRKFSSRS